MLRNNIIQVCQFHRNSIKCLYSCSSTRTQRLKPFCDYLVLYIAGHLCARRRWGLFVFLHIFVYFVARGEADVCLSQHFYIFVYIHLLLYICIYCAGRRQCLFVSNFLASPQDSTWLPICCNPVSSHYFLFPGCHFLKSVDWNSSYYFENLQSFKEDEPALHIETFVVISWSSLWVSLWIWCLQVQGVLCQYV